MWTELSRLTQLTGTAGAKPTWGGVLGLCALPPQITSLHGQRRTFELTFPSIADCDREVGYLREEMKQSPGIQEVLELRKRMARSSLLKE